MWLSQEVFDWSPVPGLCRRKAEAKLKSDWMWAKIREEAICRPTGSLKEITWNNSKHKKNCTRNAARSRWDKWPSAPQRSSWNCECVPIHWADLKRYICHFFVLPFLAVHLVAVHLNCSVFLDSLFHPITVRRCNTQGMHTKTHLKVGGGRHLFLGEFLVLIAGIAVMLHSCWLGLWWMKPTVFIFSLVLNPAVQTPSYFQVQSLLSVCGECTLSGRALPLPLCTLTHQSLPGKETAYRLHI